MSKNEEYAKIIEPLNPVIAQRVRELDRQRKNELSQMLAILLKHYETEATKKASQKERTLEGTIADRTESYRNKATQYEKLSRELADEVRGLKWKAEELEECMLYKGFYDALKQNGFYDILYNGEPKPTPTKRYLDGIKEALEYLATKPDQVIQHYGDPNPKEKTTNYYHHKAGTNQ